MFGTVSLLTVATAIAFALVGTVMSRFGLVVWHTISSMKKNYIQYYSLESLMEPEEFKKKKKKKSEGSSHSCLGWSSRPRG